MKTYTVRQADTLFAIARDEYGDGGLGPVLAAANHLTHPDFLLPGQHLLVPYVTRRHRMTSPDGDVARKSITQTYYGTTDLHTQLLWEKVNGVDQRPIDLGAWLVLPELEGAEHYPVVVPEYLSALAERWYGDSDLTTMLTLANTIAGNRIDGDLVEPDTSSSARASTKPTTCAVRPCAPSAPSTTAPAWSTRGSRSSPPSTASPTPIT